MTWLRIAANDDSGAEISGLGQAIQVNSANTRYRYNRDNTVAKIVNRAGSGTLISQHDYTYVGFGNRDTHGELIRTVTKNFNCWHCPRRERTLP
jgi:hypothetical protein